MLEAAKCASIMARAVASVIAGLPCVEGSSVSDGSDGVGRRSVEDRQVEPAEELRVGDDVHLDDPSVSDREARDRERPPVPKADRADRAVDERPPPLDI